MRDTQALRDRVDASIASLLADRSPIVRSISPDLTPIADVSLEFLRAGKRLRALFAYRGLEAARPSGASDDELAAVDALATSLEVFHAAALAHDDLVDNSDTRRGQPSLHRVFERHHIDAGWAGDAEAFGRATAMLTGDLLLGWSADLVDDAAAALPASAAAALRAEFSTMRTEVTLGQQLDIQEEHSWPVHEGDPVERALAVVIHKAARYSIERPLVLGALVGGAGPELVAALRRFALPIGIAFQLRDDLLGVYGDSATTGKPAGDDIREGKRTVLVADALRVASASQAETILGALGDQTLSPERTAEVAELLDALGARERVERRIDDAIEEAEAALVEADLDDGSRAMLRWLADAATRRIT